MIFLKRKKEVKPVNPSITIIPALGKLRLKDQEFKIILIHLGIGGQSRLHETWP